MPNLHWVSWGWDPNDREQDATFIHVFFFCLVTLMMVTGGYFIAYCPSSQMHDWAIREAYLEIRRRESAGLPHIDRNLVPEDQVELPSEEELGDMEIII
ncbi:hypothetical protein HAZT_HAZT006206 [Hyalella azteca]|uniref:NADH dehydrogenase [ubiquinone] 1 beta subcomplex subunit 11, mitochondrial n=1 Tax=Hyalella azteca TaxID=294128 RepID=A0A6A0GSJ3_HYAAZ|nr:hypothetical protein HAZT_HAZT006206 [Hyalella azteca]